MMMSSSTVLSSNFYYETVYLDVFSVLVTVSSDEEERDVFVDRGSPRAEEAEAPLSSRKKKKRRKRAREEQEAAVAPSELQEEEEEEEAAAAGEEEFI